MAIEVPLLIALRTIFFYPTRQHAYQLVVLAAMISVAWSIYLTPAVMDTIGTRHVAGSTVAGDFAFMLSLLLAEGSFPDHWRRIRDEVRVPAGTSVSDNRPSNFPLMKRLRWMFDLAYNGRMIGAFLWKTFLKLIKNFVTADIATSMLALSPAFDNRVHDPTDGPETYLTAVPFLRRVPYVLLFGIRMGASLGVVHNFMSLLFVGIGLSSPTLWPDMWGRWRDAYTVRKLWGQTWHQMLRPTLAELGKLVANKFLKFRRGTNRSSYTQLYVAFFVSGLIHCTGDFMVGKLLACPSLKYFLLQAAAITFEDFVIFIAKSLLRRWGIELKPGKADESWAGTVVRVIGYCWVILWFCFALPVWVDELNVLGANNFDRGPVNQFLLDRWEQWA